MAEENGAEGPWGRGKRKISSTCSFITGYEILVVGHLPRKFGFRTDIPDREVISGGRL